MKKATKPEPRPRSKPKPKRLTRSKTWSGYRPLSETVAILSGNFSLNHQRFAYKSKGHQNVTVCLMAVLFSKLEKVQNWTAATLDTILTSGDSFYLKMLLLKDSATAMRPVPLALLDIIEHPIYLGAYKFTIDRNLTVVQDRVSEPHVLSDCLRAQSLSTVVLAVHKYHFTVFKSDGFYCLFDPGDRDRAGNPTQPNRGSACVLRFANIDIFSRHFCGFLKLDKPVFKLFPIRIGRVSKPEPDNGGEIAVDLPSLKKKPKSKSKKSNSFCSDSVSMTGSLEVPAIVAEMASLDPVRIEGGHENVLCSLLNDQTFRTANEINCLQNCSLGPINYRIMRASYYDRNSSCLSALVMLQCHRIGFWTGSILDRVLGTRIANVHEPIECETKRFLIGTQTVRAVGRLRSKHEHVFDLENGIEAFFKTYDTGLIEGPLNVAVWTENGKFFMWNRENCNSNGIRDVQRPTNESDTVETACLLEFCRIGDLVAIYLASVDESNRNDFFMIRSIQIQNCYFVPDNWNAFLGLGSQLGFLIAKLIRKGMKNKRYWILRGDEHRSTGEIANLEMCAIYALVVYEYTGDFAQWTAATIDSIVRAASKLDDRVRDRVTFPYRDKEVHVDIERDVRFGNFRESNAGCPKPETVLEQMLGSFFDSYNLGLMAIGVRAVVVLVKSHGFFYLMNCFESNETGVKSTIGTCCVLRTTELKQLVALLVPNIDLVEVRVCSVHAVRIEFWRVDETDGIGLPNCPNYAAVEFANGPFRYGFAILRASCARVGPVSKTVALTSCFCALAMSKLLPTLDWTTSIMDEIVKFGRELRTSDDDANMTFEIGRNEFAVRSLVLDSVDGVFVAGLEPGLEDDRESETELVTESEIDLSNEIAASESIENCSERTDLRVDDLEQSLTGFFANYPCFVLVSEQWTVAFWSDNGIIYLYDPNNCHRFGSEASDSLAVQSSLMMFANFDRLRQFLPVTVAANENQTFKLIPIEIRMSLRPIERDLEPWHGFVCVRVPFASEPVWILRGSVCRADETFVEHNRGQQSFFQCVMCLCFASICSVCEFNAATIDSILFYGDRLFSAKESLEDGGGQRDDNCETVVAKVIKSFSLKHLKIRCHIKRNIVTGDLKATAANEIPNLTQALESIAATEPTKQFLAIVHLKNDRFAVFNMSDSYFLFDSDACSPTGLRTTFGKAALTRHTALATIQSLLVESTRDRDGSDQFTIDLIEVEAHEQSHFYREVLRDCSLAEIVALKRPQSPLPFELFALRATLSQDSECFGRAEHSACAANCVSVLAMQCFRKTSTWTERILDEVLMFADRELYERSRSDASTDPKLRLECLVQDFELNAHQIHFDLLQDHKLIGIWRKNLAPIRYIFEEFFQQGFQYGAFKCSLLFAVWKEELYYLFDPHAKHKLTDALAQYLDTPTTAYLLGFRTIEALAEFVLVTVPDSVPHGTEFELVPLDFRIVYPAAIADDVKPRAATDCNYTEIDATLAIAILHGSRSLYADRYETESRGCQIYTVSVMASVISILRNPRTWTSDVIDDILDIGMTLYEMIRRRNDSMPFEDSDRTIQVGFESIIRSLKNCDTVCELIQKQGTVREIPENTIIEIFKARVRHDLTFDELAAYLDEWFASESHAIIEKKIVYLPAESVVTVTDSLPDRGPESQSEFKLVETQDFVAEVEPEPEQNPGEITRIFCITIAKNSHEFYVFDPYCRDSYGNAIEIGRACVLKCDRLPPLLKKFVANTYRDREFESFTETVTYSIFTTDLKNL